MLTHIDLFAGVGGFSEGFRQAGIETVACVEIDPACQSVLRRHHPGVPILADVRECGAYNLPQADVITFGSPCQDMSVAGKRAGLNGERSGLFFEAIRIIREVRPAFAVWENVPGALSSHGGRDFGAALDALAESGALDIAWAVLDSQWFGVPQRRRRVFVVADFRGFRAGEILSIPYGSKGDPTPRRKTGQGVARCIARGTGSSGYRYDANGEDFVIDEPYTLDWQAGSSGDVSFRGKSRAWICDKPGRTRSLTANRTLAVCFEPRIARNGRGAPGPVVPSLKAQSGQSGKGDGAPMVFQSKASAQQSMNPGNVAPALDVSKAGGHVIAFDNGQGDPNADEDGTSFSLNGQSHAGVATSFGVRRLTPTECERLQAFPDGWTDGQADSARYRQMGNAVTVSVARWIGGRLILAADAERSDADQTQRRGDVGG